MEDRGEEEGWLGLTMIFALEIRNSVSKSLILFVVQSAARDPERDGIRRGGDEKLPEPSKHTKHNFHS